MGNSETIPVTALGLEVTQRCNLACSYCYLGDRSKSFLDMTNEIADKALELLFKNKNINNEVGITFWGGEPLLNFKMIKYVIEKCKELSDKSTKLNFLIITNGTILNDEMLHFFHKENVRLQISLDGDESIHDYYRKTKSGNGSYQKIMSNLQKITDYNKTNHYNNYCVKCTITKQSVPVTSILEHFNKNDFLYSITPASSSPGFEKNKLLKSSDIKKQAKLLFKDWELQFNRGEVVKNHFITKRLKVICLNEKQQYACNAGLSYFGIGADGKIYPCHRLFNDPGFVLGDVWNGINAKLSNSLFNHTIDQRESCSKCALLFMCGSTCPVDSITKGNFNKIDPVICSFNKTIIRECMRFLLATKKTNPKKYQELLNMFKSKKAKQENSSIDLPFKEMNAISLVPPGFQDKIPVKSERTRVIDLEEDGILYFEGDGDNKYIANVTTMAIWDLIDGKRTAKEIAGHIADLCKIEPEKIEGDIFKQINTLKEIGFADVLEEK